MRASRAASFAAGLAMMAGAVPVTAPSAAGSSPVPASVDRTWVWPLRPTPAVMRGFEPPAHPWDAGHRGVDLLGSPAEPVLAIGAGTVRFAGPLAGRGVVVVDHGDLRSTYEPVTAAVHRGDVVDAGEVVGLLQTPYSHCVPQVCLHLGLRRGSVYLDPLGLLGPRPVRLKPLTAADATASGPVAEPAPAPAPAMAPSKATATARRAAAGFLDGPDRRKAPGSLAHATGGTRPAMAAAAGLVRAVRSLLAALAGRGQARG
jgi:murein DD-endopeptidase MepM/ murein hydrolase activator NlpD